MKKMFLLFFGFVAVSSSAMNMEIVIKNNTDDAIVVVPETSALKVSKVWYSGTTINSETINQHEQVKLFVTLDDKANAETMIRISSHSDNYVNIIFEKIVGFGGSAFVPKLIECNKGKSSLKYNAMQSFDCYNKTHIMTISR